MNNRIDNEGVIQAFGLDVFPFLTISQELAQDEDVHTESIVIHSALIKMINIINLYYVKHTKQY